MGWEGRTWCRRDSRGVAETQEKGQGSACPASWQRTGGPSVYVGGVLVMAPRPPGPRPVPPGSFTRPGAPWSSRPTGGPQELDRPPGWPPGPGDSGVSGRSHRPRRLPAGAALPLHRPGSHVEAENVTKVVCDRSGPRLAPAGTPLGARVGTHVWAHTRVPPPCSDRRASEGRPLRVRSQRVTACVSVVRCVSGETQADAGPLSSLQASLF